MLAVHLLATGCVLTTTCNWVVFSFGMSTWPWTLIMNDNGMRLHIAGVTVYAVTCTALNGYA